MEEKNMYQASEKRYDNMKEMLFEAFDQGITHF